MTPDPLAFLRTTLDAAERDAELAADGGDGVWTVGDPLHGNGLVCDSRRNVVVYDNGTTLPAQAALIVAHDPAAVLRRIAADRKLLDECEDAYASDSWAVSGLAASVIKGIAGGWGWTPDA